MDVLLEARFSQIIQTASSLFAPLSSQARLAGIAHGFGEQGHCQCAGHLPPLPMKRKLGRAAPRCAAEVPDASGLPRRGQETEPFPPRDVQPLAAGVDGVR